MEPLIMFLNKETRIFKAVEAEKQIIPKHVTTTPFLKGVLFFFNKITPVERSRVSFFYI